MEATNIDDAIEDPVESMLKKTGCISLHYKVQVTQFIKLVIRYTQYQ